MKMQNERGIALMMVLSFFTVASLGGTAIVYLGGAQTLQAKDYAESRQAFYRAEAAAETAVALLDANYVVNVAGENTDITLGDGEFRYTVEAIDAERMRITGVGAASDFDNAASTRSVEVVVRRPSTLPNNLFDYVIYAAGEELEAEGDFTVIGDVIYADEFETDNIGNFQSDSITQDPNINPLAQLDFDAMRTIAQAQVFDGHDNYYTAAELDSGISMPANFYYQAPDPTDPSDLGIPNVIFVETEEFELEDNWGTIGGFIIVVSNNEGGEDDESEDVEVELEGTGIVNGVIYTVGEVELEDGAILLDGGIIAGGEVELEGEGADDGDDDGGPVRVQYNQAYMDSIRNMQPRAQMTIESWREVQ